MESVAHAVRVAALIPAYGEERHIADVVWRARPYVQQVWVIDDGSTDETADKARQAGAFVIRHEKNQGKGAAIKTGLRQLLADEFSYVILLDGDGQHCPEEIPLFLEAAAKIPRPFVIGSRMHQTAAMPWLRRWINRYMSAKISRVSGQTIPDTQCGFRLVSAECVPALMAASDHYDYETEMILLAAREGYTIFSVQISTIYDDERSKINPIVDTFRFLRLMHRNSLRWKRSGQRCKLP